MNQHSKGKETIFVVEEEVIIRYCLCRALQRSGYRVLEAADGLEAVAVWESEHETIDLLLIGNRILNEITGFDLVERFRRVKPGLKVVIASTNGIGTPNRENQPVPEIVYCPKPYSADEMLATVRELVTRNPSRVQAKALASATVSR
jgi:DNA-binding NtrC family response regulator